MMLFDSLKPLVTLFRKCARKGYHATRGMASILITLTVRTNEVRWRKVALAGRPSWDSRNVKISSFIPEGSSVIDLGCGAQTLKDHLPSRCEYQPCDLVQSTPEVIACDFNAGIYPHVSRKFTHAVCSGVIEYVRDHHRFLKESSALAENLIISYNLMRPGDSKLRRMANNWVNHFSRNELEALFKDAGLRGECLDTAESGEVIYRLRPC